MYWPTGTPNVYALSKQSTAPVEHQSDDGAETPEPSERSSTAESEEQDNDGSVEGVSSDEGQRSIQDGIGTSGRAHHRRVTDILAAQTTRGGSIFATITVDRLTIWQTKPVVALSSVIRSSQSTKAYGPNKALLLRPDGLVVVIQTELGYLITYTISTDPNASVYSVQLSEASRRSSASSNHYRRASTAGVDLGAGAGEGEGIREVTLRFRMVIRIDAGISRAIAQDSELLVATQKPAAVQSIRWAADDSRPQTSTELLSRMPWISNRACIVEIVHDRPMNLMIWVASDGRAYAVQRRAEASREGESPRSAFQGYCFHEPESDMEAATRVAVNARFSLIATGTAAGSIDVYVVKDYMGNIPLSHRLKLPVSLSSTGKLTFLSYSPDGYCLFAGFERGWAMWSVYGKPGASSFGSTGQYSTQHNEIWLQGISSGFWVGHGCEIALLDEHDDRIWVLEMARNAVIGNYCPSNVARGLLHTSDSITFYTGHNIPDLTALPSDAALWQTVQIPASYLINQWPIKSATISADGKYIAVAGKRGLAHYSVTSGRWKLFDDSANEYEFSVRGGMDWFQHILIASVESGRKFQVRLYSREKNLDFSHILHTQELTAPAISTAISGADSLLVYTYDNTLLHFVIAPVASSFTLVQVGQIGFHGIIRAPPRVRAISWLLPEEQVECGDPSQDVATASILFLVDGKLVLLQPSANEFGELKYDMRVIAQNVEYFTLTRDQPTTVATLKYVSGTGTPDESTMDQHLGHSLRDSLWYFDGQSFHVWSDVQDVLACAPADLGRDLPPAVRVTMDFYPLSALLAKGVIHGVDADLVQRRDVNFSFYRHAARAQLFLPQLLRYHLSEYNSPAALHLANSYQHLPYFSHALEVLLHDVLDYEVDNPPSPPETALLPGTVSFLSSFPSYLDNIVNCTRKTELRSWRTLFASLPPVKLLFEQSLLEGKLKTAAGYLLVLHAFESETFQVHEFARVISTAWREQEWELCRELARFLVGIDSTGDSLRAAMREAGLADAVDGSPAPITINGAMDYGASVPRQQHVETNGNGSTRPDYFSH